MHAGLRPSMQHESLFAPYGNPPRDSIKAGNALTQAGLAAAMGVQRKHVNELCNGRRSVTAATALILARVFGNSPDFWLNVQRRGDLWEALNSPKERERIERAKPLAEVAATQAH